jgi:hypothetical protein
MQVQVHADDSIQGGESLAQWAQEEINAKLARLKEYVVRVEVFLTGVDALKTTGGPGKRCVLETRATGRPHCSECGSRKGQGCLQRRD